MTTPHRIYQSIKQMVDSKDPYLLEAGLNHILGTKWIPNIKCQVPDGTCAFLQGVAILAYYVSKELNLNKCLEFSAQNVIEWGVQRREDKDGTKLTYVLGFLKDRGTCLEIATPYIGKMKVDQRTRTVPRGLGAKIGGYAPLAPDFKIVCQHIDTQGSVLAQIYVSKQLKHFNHNSGVFDLDHSTLSDADFVLTDTGDRVVHQVLIVGFHEGKGYYLFTNTWGGKFGHNGLGKMRHDNFFYYMVLTGQVKFFVYN